MHILLTGSNGFIGKALSQHLLEAGHQVTALLRPSSTQTANARHWNPANGECESSIFDDIDAVIHLGGVNVADKRWTAEFKTLLRTSRIDSTALLAQTMARASKKPSVYVNASAIGFYGDRPGESLTEESTSGAGFFPELSREWEAATKPAQEAGIRTLQVRIGVVLGENGGALEKMVLPFKLGVGGKLGSGTQHWSWISLRDICRAFAFLLESENLQGPVNFTGPTPVTNADFTKSLGNALNRPTILPVPAFAMKLILPGFAEEGLLADTKVLPEKLLHAGFEFKDEDLERTLSEILND